MPDTPTPSQKTVFHQNQPISLLSPKSTTSLQQQPQLNFQFSRATSYAQAAKLGNNNNGENDGFTLVTHRNQPKNATVILKPNFRDRRLILVNSKGTNLSNIKFTRDAINGKLRQKLGITASIVTSITKSTYNQNIVLVTNQGYTAEQLITNEEIIKQHFDYTRCQIDTQWFKTIIHGVSIEDFDRENGM